jgi:hypothetical protein
MPYRKANIIAKMKVTSGYFFAKLVPQVRGGERPRDQAVADREGEQAQHVVDDRRADDGPGGFRLQLPHLFQHIGRDGDARGGERRADEHGAGKGEPEQHGCEVAGGPWDDHAEQGDHEVLRLGDVLDAKLQPYDEQQHDRPEVGDAADKTRVGDEAEHARSHDKAHEDLSDDRGLVDPGGEQVPRQGNEEQEAHLELDEVDHFRH